MPSSAAAIAPVVMDPFAVRESDRDRSGEPSVPDLVAAADAVLEQGEMFLRSVPVEAYTRKHPRAFDATLGGHFRHGLDHFTSLVRAQDSGEVDYDRRDRDPRVESDPAFALKVSRQVRQAIGRFTGDDLRTRVSVRCAVTYDGDEVPPCQSTLARELVYAVTHAVHHFALMAFLARAMELPLPHRFGLAPSTARHQASLRPPAP